MSFLNIFSSIVLFALFVTFIFFLYSCIVQPLLRQRREREQEHLEEINREREESQEIRQALNFQGESGIQGNAPYYTEKVNYHGFLGIAGTTGIPDSGATGMAQPTKKSRNKSSKNRYDLVKSSSNEIEKKEEKQKKRKNRYDLLKGNTHGSILDIVEKETTKEKKRNCQKKE
jgi:hypothetical protein